MNQIRNLKSNGKKNIYNMTKENGDLDDYEVLLSKDVPVLLFGQDER